MYKGLPHLWSNPNIAELGALGVIFFFVLSGFLITFLMLNEEKTDGKISIKKFYMRRIFRIFPLYYLLVFIGFFLVFDWEFIRIPSQFKIANENYFSYLAHYLFLIPNFSIGAFNSSFPHVGQLWSIGVEEHFYLIWPFVFIYSLNKRLKAFILFFIGIVLIKLVFWFIIQLGFFSENGSIFWSNLWASEKLESMAIGGIGGYFWFTNHKILKNLKYWPGVILSVLLVFVGINYAPSIIQDGIHIIYSILFLGIIVKVLQSKGWQNFLEFKVFNYLGTISFGLYVYHLLIMTIVINFLMMFQIKNSLIFNISYYLISFGASIIISHLSFRYFEAYFLKLKKKFK